MVLWDWPKASDEPTGAGIAHLKRMTKTASQKALPIGEESHPSCRIVPYSPLDAKSIRGGSGVPELDEPRISSGKKTVALGMEGKRVDVPTMAVVNI
jgi:hypothetical protein